LRDNGQSRATRVSVFAFVIGRRQTQHQHEQQIPQRHPTDY